MTRVFLSLGSNLGDREATLREALRQLESPDLRCVRLSSIYETEPVGLREQPMFLNCAAEFLTTLTPHETLTRTQAVEQALGRIRKVLNGPRTIDIDIVLFGDRIVEAADLTIPHPRFRERRFVLEPLKEIAPDAIDPVTGHTISALLASQ